MKPELEARLQTSQYFKSSSNMEVGEAVISYANYWRSKTVTESEKSRTKMTLEAVDCNELPKVEGAGDIFLHDGYLVQRMHEGTIVHADAYCGMWTTKLINKARGHHEPQEERVFAKILESLHEPHLMLEFGAWWSFYSLWFQRKFPAATTLLVEPDPLNLAIGASNYQMNGVEGWFANAAVGSEAGPTSMNFHCESDQQTRQIPRLSVDFIVEHLQIETPIDIILIDVQGAEFEALEGMKSCAERGLVKFVVLSTHDHRLSGDYMTHENCLRYLRDLNAHIVAEHTVEESYSGDGLIVAQFGHGEPLSVNVSFNRAKNSLFGSSEDKIAVVAWELELARKTLQTSLQSLESLESAQRNCILETRRLQNESQQIRTELHQFQDRFQEQESRLVCLSRVQANSDANLHQLSFRLTPEDGDLTKPDIKVGPSLQTETDRCKSHLAEARRRHFGKKRLKLEEKEPKQGGLKRWLKSLMRPQGAINRAIFRCLLSIVKWQSDVRRQLLALRQQHVELAESLVQTRNKIAAGLSPVDAKWYLEKYSDIKRAGVDPIEHFAMTGWKEGRDPNEWFDVQWYLQRYPDVKAAKVNPLQHYYQFGRSEGRAFAGPEGVSTSRSMGSARAIPTTSPSIDSISYEESELARKIIEISHSPSTQA